MAYKKIFAACALATAVDAHMLLAKPAPFAFYSAPGQSGAVNRPLASDGSDFPCRASSGDSYTGTAAEFALGSTMDIAFTGQAVHGGGSCQFSLTTDAAPTKDSKWKVIHSIIGGCPARGEAGNMGENPEAADPYLYNFTIPTDIPSGTYTMAWSWNNRIGNREFYMNCAPVKFTGTGGAKSNLESLPDMFVSNLDSVNKCRTDAESSQDVIYPAPGASVEHVEPLAGGWKQLNPADSVPACATGFCAGGTDCNLGGSAAGSQTQSQQPSAPTSYPVSTPAATSPVEATPTASTPGGVYETVSAAADSSTATPVAATSVADPVPTSTAAASSAAGSDSSSGSASGKSSGACTPEGQFNCIDGSSYQQCASGTWSVAMPMAAGTSCTVGKSMQLSMKASALKRSVRAFQA